MNYDDRRKRLNDALEIARKHGNRYLEANILKAIAELKKEHLQGG